MSILISLLAVTATCTPAAPAKDNVAIVRKFFAAVAANDEAGIGALLKPGARMFEPDDRIGLKLDELLSMLTARGNGGMLKLIDAVPADKPQKVEIVTQAEDGPKRVALVTLDGGCIAEIESS